MLLGIITFLFFSFGMIYIFFFLFGLWCVIVTKNKKGLIKYLLFTPSLLWIMPLAAFKIIYEIFKKQK